MANKGLTPARAAALAKLHARPRTPAQMASLEKAHARQRELRAASGLPKPPKPPKPLTPKRVAILAEGRLAQPETPEEHAAVEAERARCAARLAKFVADEAKRTAKLHAQDLAVELAAYYPGFLALADLVAQVGEDVATLERWVVFGVRGVFLKAVRHGRGWATTQEAVATFRKAAGMAPERTGRSRTRDLGSGG